MKGSLTPDRIQKSLSTGDLTRENAAEQLISLIEGSNNTEIRIQSIKIFEKLKIQNENLFKIMENCLISDENGLIRAEVAKYIIQNYLEEGITALIWSIQHDKSPLVLILFFDFIEKFESPQFESIKEELFVWNKDFSKKIGIVPQESRFFLDLEVLFAKSKENYSIDPYSYEFFETIKSINERDPWLNIKDNHVQSLTFNYFNWKYVKFNSDILKSFLKLQDIEVYLNSLRKYSQNDVLLQSVPESIGTLSSLEKLNLRRNGLETLPNSFKNLTLLKELDLSYNRLEEIPEYIYTFNNLETVNIKHNNIQNIPESSSNKIKVIR
jgi:Leucine-rich repeat (LRR) protein